MQTVNVKLDDQCVEIISNIPEVLRNSAINIALKMFSESDIYYKYFAEKVEELQEPTITVTNNNPSVAGHPSSAPTAPAPAKPQQPENIVTFDDF